MKDSAELAKISSHPTSGSEIFVLLKTSSICEKLKSNPVKMKTPPKNLAVLTVFVEYGVINCSYAMMAKSMETLEFHYSMIQIYPIFTSICTATQQEFLCDHLSANALSGFYLFPSLHSRCSRNNCGWVGATARTHTLLFKPNASAWHRPKKKFIAHVMGEIIIPYTNWTSKIVYY